MVTSKVFFAVILATFLYTNAWMPSTAIGTRSRGIQIRTSDAFPKSRSFKSLNAETPEATVANNEEDGDTTIAGDDADNKPKVEWGVSYIGGDPCGSKYNSDPFDKNPSEKPGLPDDMRARIEALAQKKLQEEREKSN